MSRLHRATRPKKLNSKQNVQIFREDQIESLADYDSQRAAIETGVEKAEEAVCCPLFPSHLRDPSVAVSSSSSLSHPHLGALFTYHFDRNTIFNRPSKHLKLQKPMQRSKMHTFPPHPPSPVMSNMMSSTQKDINFQPHTFARLPQWKTAQECRIVWTTRMNLP